MVIITIIFNVKLCPFSKLSGCKIFLKFVRDGRNIKWIRGVYNIELQKLFSLKRDFEVIKVKKVLCTEKCKM